MAEEVKKIFNSQFHNQVKEDLNNIILRDDGRRSFELAELIEKILSKYRVDFQQNEEEREFYRKIMIKAKFIALPLIDSADVLNLLKNYFLWQFRIPDYDIISKINAKLTTFIIMEERDSYKEELRRALINNREVITSAASIRTIENWIKDYTAQVGPGPADNVERRQYFTNLTKNKEIDEGRRWQLSVLLTLYELLKYPSSTPLGHEESYIIEAGGEKKIFDRGQIADLKFKDAGEYERIKSILDSLKETKKETIKTAPLESRSAQSRPSSGEVLRKLRELSEQYPEDSLERRAVEEEIRKYEARLPARQV